MKKTFTVFYKSGNKVVIETSDLTVEHGYDGVSKIVWTKDGNIFYINPDGIEAIVKGKQ